jgi:hypothetical protein
LYQVVAVGGPAGRLNFGCFPTKMDALDHACSLAGELEVVNEKTGLLIGTSRDGEWTEQLTPTRRAIV